MKILFMHRTLLLTLILFFCAEVLFAVTTDREPNVLIYSHPVDEYVNILIADHLGNNGLNAIIIDQETDLDELLDTSGWLGAFFLIDIAEAQNNLFEINLTVYSTWNKEEILNVIIENSEFEDPLLKVTDVINRYLETEEVKNMIAEMESEPAPQEEEAPPNVEEPEEKSQFEDGGIEQTPAKEDTIQSRDVLTQVFQLSACAAPFISVFNVSEYFKIGFDTSFSFSRLLELPFADLLLGGMVNYVYFNAEGIYAVTTNHLTSIGFDSQIFLNTDINLKNFAAISAGVSLFDAVDEAGELYNSFLPFVFVGAGTLINITNKFDFKLYIKYSMYMEKTILISGFSPSIGVSYSL